MFRLEAVDSQLLGRPVLTLEPTADALADLAATEEVMRREHQPCMVSVKVPVEDVASVHALEGAGFQLVETQLKCVAFPQAKAVPSLGLSLEPVDTPQALDAAAALAARAFTQDRYTHDPAIPPGFSQARYQAFLRRSAVTPGERVLGLVLAKENRLVGFKSHRINGDQAVLLLGAVDPDVVGMGFGAVSGQLELSMLAQAGVKQVVTHYPVRNYGVVNLELRGLGFQMVAAFYVVRKVYGTLKLAT